MKIEEGFGLAAPRHASGRRAANADAPMYVTESGITTDVSWLFCCVCTRRSAGSVQAAARGTVNAIEATRATKHRVQCPRGSSAQYGETGEVLCLVQAAARRTPVYTSREQRLQGAACNTHGRSLARRSSGSGNLLAVLRALLVDNDIYVRVEREGHFGLH